MDAAGVGEGDAAAGGAVQAVSVARAQACTELGQSHCADVEDALPLAAGLERSDNGGQAGKSASFAVAGVGG